MKRFQTALVLLSLCGFCAALQQPSSGNSKQAQPAGKHVPQAKTHAEFTDYNVAYATAGGAAVEKAADEFAAKYPASELKAFLYAKAMHEYQNENNPAKMLSVGEKVLQLDPDNSIALVLTSTVLADSLKDADTDRQAKIARARKNATRALETVDSAFVPPANATPEQVTAYKSTLQSMAHSALGIVALKTGDDATAENELKLSTSLNVSQPDPYLWYHLALAQDHRKKYAAALSSVNQALQLSSSNPDLQRMAEIEHDRLSGVSRGRDQGTTGAEPPQ